MRKVFLPFLFAFLFVFSPVANAAEQFSFGGINLSFTPQQIIEKGLADLPDAFSRIHSTIKPERYDYLEAVNGFTPSGKQYEHIKIAVGSNSYPIRLVGISLMDKRQEQDAILKIFSLPIESMRLAEGNYRNFFINPSDLNELIWSKEHGFRIDYVKFKSKEHNATIEIYYVSMPGFDRRALYMKVNGEKNRSSMQYVLDVFNERYGEGKVFKSALGELSSCIWESSREVAIYTVPNNLSHLDIIDKEAYAAFINFSVQEQPKAEARLKAAAEAEKAAKINTGKSKI